MNTQDAIRALRIQGLVDDADWSDLEALGVADVLFVQTGPDLWSPVVVFAATDFRWSLADRGSEEGARAAARLLLKGLASLRRLTIEKHPWAPHGAGVDGPRGDARLETIDKAVQQWRARVSAMVIDF